MRIGQRVRVISAINHNLIGRSGSVVATRKNGYSVGVELDYYEEGHTCSGNAQDGRGKWFNVTQVTLEGGTSSQVQTYKEEETGMNSLRKLSTIARTAFSADMRALVRIGYLTSDLEVTGQGQEALTNMLFEANKAELAKVAKGLIKEIEDKDSN